MMVTRKRVVHALLGVLLTTAVSQAGATDTEASIAAVWYSQVVKFEYRAGGTVYMCRSLQRKVEQILLQVGVRDRARFVRFYCGELSSIVTAKIAVVSPIEATEENLRRLTDYDSKDVLIARVQGRSLPAATDVPVFTAAWRTVSLSGMRFTRGDCELLQQLRQQVLPKLAVRIVGDNLQHCSTAFARSAEPQLVVQALITDHTYRLVNGR